MIKTVAANHRIGTSTFGFENGLSEHGLFREVVLGVGIA
jgi:hypothetical protein